VLCSPNQGRRALYQRNQSTVTFIIMIVISALVVNFLILSTFGFSTSLFACNENTKTTAVSQHGKRPALSNRILWSFSCSFTTYTFQRFSSTLTARLTARHWSRFLPWWIAGRNKWFFQNNTKWPATRQQRVAMILSIFVWCLTLYCSIFSGYIWPSCSCITRHLLASLPTARSLFVRGRCSRDTRPPRTST